MLTRTEKFLLASSLVMFLFAIFLGCSCGMSIHKPTAYKGKPEAVKPYVEMGKMDTIMHSCDYWTHSCEISIGINPYIHNPTRYYLKGQVVCKFEATDTNGNNEVKVAKSAKPIVLGPRGSKTASVKVYVGHSFTVSSRTDVSASCWLRYLKYDPFDKMVD